MRELRTEAVTENLAAVFTFLQDYLVEHNAPKKLIRQIKLCVEEIYVNISHYAYSPDVGYALIIADVTDNADGSPPRIVITFIDEGKPYDPLAKEDPDLDLGLDDAPIGGLGIYLVKTTMDNVSYERKDGRNIFIMEKSVDAAAS